MKLNQLHIKFLNYYLITYQAKKVINHHNSALTFLTLIKCYRSSKYKRIAALRKIELIDIDHGLM